jgi:hypothetical protein
VRILITTERRGRWGRVVGDRLKSPYDYFQQQAVGYV